MYILRIQSDEHSFSLQDNLEGPIWFNRVAYAAGVNSKGHTWVEFKIQLRELPKILTKISQVDHDCIWIGGLRKVQK